MPGKTTSKKVPFSLSDLHENIPKIFDQVQVSTANHQKNFVALHKLQSDTALHTEPATKGKGFKLTGERTFGDVFLIQVARILPVKKGATQVDRIVKFVGGFTKFINEKASESHSDEDEDTTASRFVARLLKFLFQGFLAKDKSVRYRVVQLVAEMVSHLGEIDEDVYITLRSSLLDRINDKEPNIRVHAVAALSKLCAAEDPEDLAEGDQTVTEFLIETLAHDSSPDVRRTALLNIPLSHTTLPAILTRTRDTDTALRRLVYSAVLEPNTVQNDTAKSMGVTHPRALSIAQREMIVRNGLGDREAGVKSAAAAVIGAWIDVVGGDDADGKESDVIALLSLFDLTEGQVAEDALLSVFESRVDVFDNLEFGEAFWSNLTPERAFLARVFVQHCANTSSNARLESALPVVTALAFRIQSNYNDLLELIQAEEEDKVLGGDDDEGVKREEERCDKEFVVGEMCVLAVRLDYSDEIGRRKMFQLVRDMISQEVLPENLVSKCMDVLRTLSADERDLIRLVVEVVHDLRDPSDPEDDISREQSAVDDAETAYGETPAPVKPTRLPKPAAAFSPEEQARADSIDLRCLSLCIGMLERVNGTFEENSTLEGILGELIIPAVKRKELALREKGLVSLGLCCLIAKRMALNSFQLFLSQIQSAPDVLKIRVLQIVFDILMVHEGEFLGREGPQGDMIINFLLHVLGNEESGKVQALMCIGIAKLLLAGIIKDDRVLKSLVLTYLSPETSENQELRQCLSYFFPVYCYSSAINQRRMQSIFIPVFEHMLTARKELDEDEEMVTLAQIGGMFVDWTDPQKAVDIRGQSIDELIHIELAGDIFKTLLTKDLEKEEKKVLCQLLGKLFVPETLDDDKLRTLKLLMHNLGSRRPLRDTTANNAFTRFDTAISKKFEKQLEDFNEDEYRKLEELKELFEFLDEIIPEDEDEDEPPKKRATKKRRSESVVSTTSRNSDDSSAAPSKRRGNTKSRVKRRRLSKSDNESDFDDGRTEQGGTPPLSTAPTRNMPRRSTAAKKLVLDANSDESEEEWDSKEQSPAPPARKGQSNEPKRKSPEERKLDAEIDGLLESDNSVDSILDASDDEEEDVMNDLLLSDSDE